MAAGPPPYAARGRMHPLTLRFLDPDREADYRASRDAEDFRQIGLAIVIGGLVNFGFAFLDAAVVPRNMPLVVALRCVFGLVLLSGLIWLYTDRLGRLSRPVLIFLGVLNFTVGYALIVYVGNPPDVYLSGYVITILFVSSCFPLGVVSLFAIVVTNTFLFSLAAPFLKDVPAGALMTIYSQFLAALVMSGFVVHWLERHRRLQYLNLQDISRERRLHHDLLERLLPADIVARLEAGEAHIAEDYADASVLFADIVGFTELSSRQYPAEVVEFLDTVFGRFDVLAKRYGVEKVKTIGDAYLAVGGVPVRRSGHTEAVADLALDMMDAARHLSAPGGGPLKLRIGIHAGPVLAGVIGESRFGFDLWGDTVNIASRLQSAAAPNGILASDLVKKRLGADYAFEAREDVDIRGKGMMKVWYLTAHGHKAANSVAP